GTVVELTTGEVGVVSGAPAIGTPLDRPWVRILAGARAGLVVDLNEKVEGEYLCSVRHVLNPANQGQLPGVDVSLLQVGGAG
ncbi:MAG: hypothetical protein H5T84_06375, partial [Thermoleophilia bacterium]|nr:hypothetical protein [Thermoleophilia bacterium]